jgi:hypothetical protein
MKAGGGAAFSAAALATAMPTANAASSAKRFNDENICKDMGIKRKPHPFSVFDQRELHHVDAAAVEGSFAVREVELPGAQELRIKALR